MKKKTWHLKLLSSKKIIEAQYITRSISSRADKLAVQAKELSEQNVLASKLSNLSLQLYSTILKTGYVKNEEESQMITKYFNDRLPKFKLSEAGFREKLWYYKAHLWYSFLMQDFKNCYKYAYKWIDLFHQNPSMINLNPVFYLKGNNYLLEAIYFTRNKQKFVNQLEHFKENIIDAKFNKDENVLTLIFLYTNFHNINQYFIDGTFDEGLEIIPKIENELVLFKDRIDPHHKMIFYYKFASLHFGAGNNQACILYLNKIISNKSLTMREDLMCFSRVLNLVAHYEAGLDYNLESLLRSTYKFLIKMNDLHEVQKEMIKFIRSLQDIYPQDLKRAFKALLETLKKYEEHPYERRAFLYLDIISWLESKIQNRTVQDIIKEKRQLNSLE